MASVCEDPLSVGRVLYEIKTGTLPPDPMQPPAGQIGVPVRLSLHFERGLLILYDKSRALDLAAPYKVVA
ncbi:hypothetical protein ACRAWG_06085 [Methylobacterium sp. P31]